MALKVKTNWTPKALVAAVARAASWVMLRAADAVAQRGREIVRGFSPEGMIPATPAALESLREANLRREYSLVPDWQPFPLPPAGPQTWIAAIADAFTVQRDWSGNTVWTTRNTSNLSALYEFGGRQTMNVWQLRSTGQMGLFAHTPRNPRKWIYTGRTVEVTYPPRPHLGPALHDSSRRITTLWENAIR